MKTCLDSAFIWWRRCYYIFINLVQVRSVLFQTNLKWSIICNGMSSADVGMILASQSSKWKQTLLHGLLQNWSNHSNVPSTYPVLTMSVWGARPWRRCPPNCPLGMIWSIQKKIKKKQATLEKINHMYLRVHVHTLQLFPRLELLQLYTHLVGFPSCFAASRVTDDHSGQHSDMHLTP